jgi:hypothetical protein
MARSWSTSSRRTPRISVSGPRTLDGWRPHSSASSRAIAVRRKPIKPEPAARAVSRSDQSAEPLPLDASSPGLWALWIDWTTTTRCPRRVHARLSTPTWLEHRLVARVGKRPSSNATSSALRSTLRRSCDQKSVVVRSLVIDAYRNRVRCTTTGVHCSPGSRSDASLTFCVIRVAAPSTPCFGEHQAMGPAHAAVVLEESSAQPSNFTATGADQ